ncbi:Zinc finger protein 862 [Dissostichus eleginoides]|uniref:Zinc finger protein 862 n=1 Tax=Dissostichus eleginoides TaxID=100907 RepID=A0AAD9C4W4_DISEL|nr:Zinc finger protein 862 [Dissostichus eleginoides]
MIPRSTVGYTSCIAWSETRNGEDDELRYEYSKYFKRIRCEEERRGKVERPQPVVSESAGTNSQSTEGEAAGPSVVEAAEGPSVVEAAAGPSVIEAAAGPSVVEAAAGPSVIPSIATQDGTLTGSKCHSSLYLTQHGMFCRICRQHKPPVKKGPLKRAFIEVVKHQVSLASGYSVMQAFEPTVIMEHEAVIGGFKCLYWLVKNEMAHHTNYPKLLSLAQLLGCDYFEKLKVDQRNNYQSHRIVDEMLEILAQIVELPILQEIRSSQAISLEVDETTDVSVSRQLDIHVRHLDKDGYVFNHFLDLVTLEDGKADSVVAAIKSVLQKKELPVDRLYGLGTDGAAVMTGRLNGVAKQLTDSFPKLVSVACAAHRLALA